METGYDTFLKEEKVQILAVLKKQILAVRGLDSPLSQPDTNGQSVDWMDMLKEIGTKQLNQLLKKVIPQYVRLFFL